MYNNRVRDFTTVLAFNTTTVEDIGMSGEREPRIFSKAVKEAELDDKTAADIFNAEFGIRNAESNNPALSVRTATIETAKAAIDNGADVVYVGGVPAGCTLDAHRVY